MGRLGGREPRSRWLSDSLLGLQLALDISYMQLLYQSCLHASFNFVASMQILKTSINFLADGNNIMQTCFLFTVLILFQDTSYIGIKIHDPIILRKTSQHVYCIIVGF
jgi:hypothetical protein